MSSEPTEDETAATRNHWDTDGNLIIMEKTMFRQVGWQGQTGALYESERTARLMEKGGYSPLYVQIATWREGEGWCD